jgi:hypothetical protein
MSGTGAGSITWSGRVPPDARRERLVAGAGHSGDPLEIPQGPQAPAGTRPSRPRAHRSMVWPNADPRASPWCRSRDSNPEGTEPRAF